MSLDNYRDVLTTTNPGHITAWPTNPARPTWRQRLAAWIARDQKPATSTGRHRATPNRVKANADYNPLQPADRLRMAPTYWADPDRHLPAPEGERTGRMDTGAVLNLAKPTEPAPADRDQVLAEMRDALTAPADDDQTTDTTGEKDQ